MKGYIFIKAKPEKDGCTLKGKVNLNGVNAAGKCALLEVILRQLEIDTDLARVFLDVIEKEQEDNPNE